MASTYEKIATNTVSGTTTTSVTLSSIPSTYTDLILIGSIKGDTASMSLGLRFNGDSGTNYSTTFLEGDGSSAVSSRQTNQTKIFLSASISYNSTNFGTQIIQLMNYSNTTTYKTLVERFNSNGGSFPGVNAGVGLWRNTSAINQLEILVLVAGQFFAAGSTFTLYGIKSA